MKEKLFPVKHSLTLALSVSMIFTSMLVFIGYGIYSYSYRSDYLESEIRQQAEESALRLSAIIADYIDAYQINEYEKLLLAEINTENHDALLAILVDNFPMAELTGKNQYQTGYIRLPDSSFVAYRDSEMEFEHLLASAFHHTFSKIHNDEGAAIGRVDAYVTDRTVLQEKRKLLFNIISTMLVLLTIQAFLSMFLIRWIFLRPLNTVVTSLCDRDSDGLPINNLASSRYSELNTLTHTVNEMLKVISSTRSKLRVEHEKLEHVITGTDAGTWFWNIKTGETQFNQRWANIIGYDLDELAPVSIDTWLAHTHPDDLSTSSEKLEEHFAGKTESYECEARMRHKQGHWVWVLDRGKVAKWDKEGKPIEMFGIHLDITEVKRREQQLELAANVYKFVNEGIVITDHLGKIVDVNNAFCRITGYQKSEAIGNTVGLLKSGLHDNEFYQELWSTLVSCGYWRGEIWNKRKNGQVYPELLTISQVKQTAEDETLYVALFSDISALKEHEQHLEIIAHYDALTGLPNRILVLERLAEAMASLPQSQHSLAVIFLDLDGFKEVNDNYGHNIGDDVLKLMAMRMKTHVRSEDTLARFGGDEFILIMPSIRHKGEIVPIVKRLLNSILKPIVNEDFVIHLSASIGISIYSGKKTVNGDELIRQADHAMYQAKMGGKNGYCFYQGESSTDSIER